VLQLRRERPLLPRLPQGVLWWRKDLLQVPADWSHPVSVPQLSWMIFSGAQGNKVTLGHPPEPSRHFAGSRLIFGGLYTELPHSHFRLPQKQYRTRLSGKVIWTDGIGHDPVLLFQIHHAFDFLLSLRPSTLSHSTFQHWIPIADMGGRFSAYGPLFSGP
jgi:hypothetical protein